MAKKKRGPEVIIETDALADAYASYRQIPKEVALQAIEDIMSIIRSTAQSLSPGVGIRLEGLGVLAKVIREARTGRNPSTGETIQIAAKNALTFKLERALRKSLNP